MGASRRARDGAHAADARSAGARVRAVSAVSISHRGQANDPGEDGSRAIAAAATTGGNQLAPDARRDDCIVVNIGNSIP